MRLSDAGMRCRKAKAVYLNHRLPPWLTEDATRDRSNRLLGLRLGMPTQRRRSIGCTLWKPLPPTISWPRRQGIARQTRLEPQPFASRAATGRQRIAPAHTEFQCMFRRVGDGQMFAQLRRQAIRQHQTRYPVRPPEQESISSVY
jgi:hypothetical protein